MERKAASIAMGFVGALTLFGLVSTPAWAQQAEEPTPAPDPPVEDPEDSVDDDADSTIIVYGDPFARWDNTRWLIESELGTPFIVTLAKDENKSFRTQLIQVRTVIQCTKDWRLSRRKYEVDCTIEDVSLRAVLAEGDKKDRKTGTYTFKEGRLQAAEEVLTELHGKLINADIQLQVTDRGRVVNVDLEGLKRSNRRENEVAESLRMLMSAMVDGFDMKLRKHDILNQGQWVEYNTALMKMPMYSGSAGSSMVVNQLDRLDGHVVVQSKGRGMVAISSSYFDVKLEGVSIYDEDEGYMTERVFALWGRATASSGYWGQGMWRAGRIRQLAEKEPVALASSGPVSPPNQQVEGLPAWIPLEPPDGASSVDQRPQ